jgi:lipopolysaccharide transport system ATP-binding protein
MNKNVIECIDLCKIYEGNKSAEKTQTINALKNINFVVEKGDRVGLIGLNGAGKSTLLKILSGSIKPDKGKIYLSSLPVSLSHFDSLLHPDLTGYENLKLQMKILKITNDSEQLLKEAIEFSELGEFIHQSVKTYSSGMMLRLAFSIFKISDAKILLLDEVFSAGDLVFQRKIEEYMNVYLKRLDALIIATHNLIEVASLCNKCLILKNGEIEFYGSINDGIDIYHKENISIETNQSIKPNFVLTSCTTRKKNETHLISEPVFVDIYFEKRCKKRLDIVLYIRNHYQNVLTDCIIYRENYEIKDEVEGNYFVSIEIPPFLLNTGTYFIDLSFGDGYSEIDYISNCASFKISPDQWEANRLWNTNPTFPVRPRLNWSKKILIND